MLHPPSHFPQMMWDIHFFLLTVNIKPCCRNILIIKLAMSSNVQKKLKRFHAILSLCLPKLTTDSDTILKIFRHQAINKLAA